MTTMHIPKNVDAISFFESVPEVAEVSLPNGKTFCIWSKESLEDLACILANPEFRKSLERSAQQAHKGDFEELDLDTLP